MAATPTRSAAILRNRVDEFGVSEPSIVRQGARRIVVELPGIQDPVRARALIGKTALLEFKLIADAQAVSRVLEIIPDDLQFLWSSKSPDNSGTRIFNELWDDTWSAGIDLNLHPRRDLSQLAIKTRFDILDRNRDAESRVFRHEPVEGAPLDSLVVLQPEQVFIPECLGPGYMYLMERTQSTDDYTADQNLLAAYVMMDVPLTDLWQVTGGVRAEQSLQEVTSYERFNPAEVPSTARIFTTDALPAMTLIHALRKDAKLRFAASQTVSRPDFRELSLYRYSDYDGGYSVIGNPDLESALIRNLDLRYEQVWGGSNLASASLFYKHFSHPIEVVRVSGSAKDISFFNARNAYSYGLETKPSAGMTATYAAVTCE